MAVSVEQTVATLRARASALRAAWELRRTDLRERLSRSLRTSLPAGVEARLIGSLVWAGFGEHSDIDLVLRGADSSRVAATNFAPDPSHSELQTRKIGLGPSRPYATRRIPA